MRVTLFLLPALLFQAAAQTPAPKPAGTPAGAAKAATPAPKPAAVPGAVKPAIAVRKPVVAPKPAPKPMTDDDKAIYAVGLSMYRSLGQFDLSPAELDLVKQALTD